jgi:MoxR-like ATPase
MSMIALGRARAFLEGRTFVYPDDIRAIAPAALRHRVTLSYRALADRVNVEELLDALLASVPIA